MRVVVSPTFSRNLKKLKSKEKEEMDGAVRTIIAKPECGEAKKGDLLGVRVYKFKLNKQQILLSYEVKEEAIYLLTFGPYENFYRDLKRK
ncbi:MAG: addiction module toxin RelE [Opitutae bacterium]|nr:addiction module toxin RelE [Opitutae bacterium]